MGTQKDILVKAFYLVEKEKEPIFQKAISLLRIAPGNFRLAISGPLPPFNFIKIGSTLTD